VNRTKKVSACRAHLRNLVAYPAVSVAVVLSVALMPFAPTRVMALVVTTSPTTASAAAPVGHLVLARIDDASFLASYLPIDDPLLDEPQLQTFRVRFQLDNATTSAITVNPQLEYRPDGGDGYLVVPEKPRPGEPFQAAREIVSAPGGSTQSPLGEDIAATDLMIIDDAGGLAVIGHHSMGTNPDVPLTLPANSYTEQEFTVLLSADALSLTGYQLRVTDAGAPLTGTAVAAVRVSATPSLPVESGQPTVTASSTPSAAASSSPTTGVSSSPTAGASSSPTAGVSSNPTPAASSNPKPAASSSPTPTASSSPRAGDSSSSQAAPQTGVTSTSTLRYALDPAVATPAAPTSSDIHGPYSMTTDQCAVCHRVHTAKDPNLLTKPASQSNLCFTCHGGLGADLNVESQYADAKPNIPSAREYYSHDVTAPTTHTLSSENEFEGVSNRHSECADCHNPHKATAGDTEESTDGSGWGTSGRLAGVSGVSVANGAANAPPAYTFLDGKTNLVTREYQLCFKCHSGFTTLPDNAGFPSSQALLDKGQEFNPDNASFHPIEAPGTNKTTAMTNSLAASGFTTKSTIRCSNCHAGAGATTPVTPIAAGADLAPHASSNQGILLQKYQDRVLNSGNEPYQDADFKLCFMCHSEAPFATSGSDPATNFSLHGKHMTALTPLGSGGTNIDTPGAGRGNAICAECHYRLHSSRFVNDKPEQDPLQTLDGSRLVNFAPNVEPGANGKISWSAGSPGSGSCTLTCHGYAHEGKKY
jgi:predicted CXXCH cytochrome family protein